MNVTQKLEQMMQYEFKQAKTPMSDAYHLELDESPLLNPTDASKHHALIGPANWVILLGRFDIAYATNTLAKYSMQPREGHLKALTRLFGYLKRFTKGKIVIDQFHWIFPQYAMLLHQIGLNSTPMLKKNYHQTCLLLKDYQLILQSS